MVFHQVVQDDVSPRAAVKNIPNNMEPIYNEPLDGSAEGNNKGISPINVDDGRNNVGIVFLFIMGIIIDID